MGEIPLNKPTELSLNSLAEWTNLHPASPRQTVNLYLASILPSTSYTNHNNNQLPSSPNHHHHRYSKSKHNNTKENNKEEQEERSSSPAPLRQEFNNNNNNKNKLLKRRDRFEEEDEVGNKPGGYAMVLHRDDENNLPSPPPTKKIKNSTDLLVVEEKRKPSVVQSLKPRNNNLSGSSGLLVVEKQKKKKSNIVDNSKPKALLVVKEKKDLKGKGKEISGGVLQEIDLEEDLDGTSSPLIVARIDIEKAKAQKKVDDDEILSMGESEDEEIKENVVPIKKRNVVVVEKGKKKDTLADERRSSSRNTKPELKVKAKEKRGREDDYLSEEDLEQQQRLDDRRDRRRAKALIVKDKTQSAKATGKAAANRLILATATTTSKSKSKSKKSTRPIVPGETTSETSSADFEVVIEKQEKKAKKVKKGNTMDEINKLVQGGKKAGNIAGGSTRLTLGPVVKMGLFGRGVASGRTKVGSSKNKIKSLPDLAFSELNFLNGPTKLRRRSTASSSSSCSSSSSSSSSSEALPVEPITSPPPRKKKKKVQVQQRSTKDKNPVDKDIVAKVQNGIVTYGHVGKSDLKDKGQVREKDENTKKGEKKTSKEKKKEEEERPSSKYFDLPDPVEEEEEEVEAVSPPKRKKDKSKEKVVEKQKKSIEPQPIVKSKLLPKSTRQSHSIPILQTNPLSVVEVQPSRMKSKNVVSSLASSVHSAYSLAQRDKELKKQKVAATAEVADSSSIIPLSSNSHEEQKEFEELDEEVDQNSQLMLDTTHLWNFPPPPPPPLPPTHSAPDGNHSLPIDSSSTKRILSPFLSNPTTAQQNQNQNQNQSENSSSAEERIRKEEEDLLIEGMIRACDEGRLDFTSPFHGTMSREGSGQGNEYIDEGERDLNSVFGLDLGRTRRLGGGGEDGIDWDENQAGGSGIDYEGTPWIEESALDQFSTNQQEQTMMTSSEFDEALLLEDYHHQNQSIEHIAEDEETEDGDEHFIAQEESEEEYPFAPQFDQHQHQQQEYASTSTSPFVDPSNLFNNVASTGGTFAGVGRVGGSRREEDDREFSETMRAHWYRSKP